MVFAQLQLAGNLLIHRPPTPAWAQLDVQEPRGTKL